MSELFTLQNKFQEHLLTSDNEIFHDIVSTEKVPTDVRLSIYSEAYRSRLLEALATNFSVLQIYLGHEQFEALAYEYIDMFPSHFRSIRWFGDHLENYLQENEPYSDYPYLAELAKIEWTQTIVFDAMNSDVVTQELLGKIPPESWVDMCFDVHPSVHLLQLSWNTVSIWQALSQEESPEELRKSDMPVTWMFWRQNLINYYCSLTSDEEFAFVAVLKGKSFGEICEGLCDFVDEEEVAMRAASLLKGWIAADLITKIKY